MSINTKLLEILVCPENKLPLELANDAQVTELNTLIDSGRLKNRAGNVISERLDGLLLRKDQKVAYPIRNDIPIMLIDEGIQLGV